MLKDRTILTLALSVLLATWIAANRPHSHVGGMVPDLFWLRKLDWNAEYDVVVAGASRVLEGVSPHEMSRELPGKVIANFGFGHTGYDLEYMTSIRRLLRSGARPPVIVLSVHPLVFTANAAEPGHSEFHKWATRPAHQLASDRLFGAVTHFYRPIGTKRLRNAWKGRREKGSRVFRESGWLSAAPIPESPEKARQIYPGLFRNNPVVPGMVDEFLLRVGMWRDEGIRIYGIRPPVPGWLEQLEKDLSGFEYGPFIRRFETAGGVWLRPPRDGYHCYDGAHMVEASARRYSRELGKALARELSSRSP